MNKFHRFLYCLRRFWREFTCRHNNQIKRFTYKGNTVIICSNCHRATLDTDEDWDLY